LTSIAVMGHNFPYNVMKRKVTTADFLASHPVFSLDEAAAALEPPGGRSGTVERLKHYLETGRLLLAAREVYAVVPPGLSAATFAFNPFLVAAACRPDGIFAYHSALELLGVAHSAWNRCTLYTGRKRRSIHLGTTNVVFLDPPGPLRGKNCLHVGTRLLERSGRMLRVTGPERTLIESLRRPALSGGLEEVLNSASAFPVLDLGLLLKILGLFGSSGLSTAVGWFLERFRETYHVPDKALRQIERRRPRSPRYMERGQRGGVLLTRWNLIVPRQVASMEEPDER